MGVAHAEVRGLQSLLTAWVENNNRGSYRTADGPTVCVYVCVSVNVHGGEEKDPSHRRTPPPFDVYTFLPPSHIQMKGYKRAFPFIRSQLVFFIYSMAGRRVRAAERG